MTLKKTNEDKARAYRISCLMKKNIGGRGLNAKQKYQGMVETQESGDKTSTGEIGLNIRTLEKVPKWGQDQMLGGVRVLCWHAATFANVLWKPHVIK